MKNLLFIFITISLVSLSSCDIFEQSIQTAGESGTVYFWLASDADTYVELVGGTTPTQANNSGHDFLAVQHSVLGVKRTYVNFPLPSFPEGTEINEVYFEMFHSGQNEDGKTDDINIDVTEGQNYVDCR